MFLSGEIVGDFKMFSFAPLYFMNILQGAVLLLQDREREERERERERGREEENISKRKHKTNYTLPWLFMGEQQWCSNSQTHCVKWCCY